MRSSMVEKGKRHMGRSRIAERVESTRSRIRAAATQLFLSRAYHDVRVAEIANAAASNIAAVNYYFGSKENLFIDIFNAECDKMALIRASRLDEVFERTASPTIDDIVHAWLDPVFENYAITENRIIFTHLMTLVLWSDVNDKIKKKMSESLAVVDDRFVDAILQVRPDLDRNTVVWRMFSSLGAYSLALGHPELVDFLYAESTCDRGSVDHIREQLFTYIATGLAAPAVKAVAKGSSR